MAISEHVDLLRSNVDLWNQWRAENPDLTPDLSGASLGWNLAQYPNAGISFIRNEVVEHEPRLTLAGINLSGADLTGAELDGADLSGANLRGASLIGADLAFAICRRTDFGGARLNNSWLIYADLTEANLTGADVEGLRVFEAHVYGTSTWSTIGTPANARDLVITPPGEAKVTVDDLAVAQFVHSLLDNANIRDVVDTVSKKGVLILGRFGEDRIELLNQLRDRLRSLGWVPFVFDFEKPASQDFTQTVRTLAGMSAFIIADLTAPRSTPHEAQAIIPDYMVPFVPIIAEGERPYAMFQDLWAKHDWVLAPRQYRTGGELIDKLQEAVIDPAVAMIDVLDQRRQASIRSAVVPLSDL